MGFYTVSSIPLAPIAGIHGGTGFHTDTNWVVDPATVPGSNNLVFAGLTSAVTTMLFQLNANVVPNWFGVAVPVGIADFTRPHIFFHPTPGQALYNDAAYPSKTQKWPELFYYMERLGYQLDGARRNQIIIMPFLTETRKDTGILPANWQDIVTDILTQVRAVFDPADNSPLTITQLVVSSYSAGIVYSDAFRHTGTNVSSFLAEIWDFDGRFSSYNSLSTALHNTASYQVIKYDQVSEASTQSYHMPLPRWADYAGRPTNNMQVHALIRDFMFLHAATATGVGQILPGPADGTPGTHTATHTASHTATTTGSHTASHTATATGSHTTTATASHSGTITGTHTASATASHSGGEIGTHTATATGTHSGTEIGTHTATGTHTAPQPGAPQAPAEPGGAPLPPFPFGPRPPFTLPSPPPLAPSLPQPMLAGPGPAPVPPPPAQLRQAPAPAIPPPQALRQAGSDCGCNTAVVGIFSLASTTATAAITAITALARKR